MFFFPSQKWVVQNNKFQTALTTIRPRFIFFPLICHTQELPSKRHCCCCAQSLRWSWSCLPHWRRSGLPVCGVTCVLVLTYRMPNAGSRVRDSSFQPTSYNFPSFALKKCIIQVLRLGATPSDITATNLFDRQRFVDARIIVLRRLWNRFILWCSETLENVWLSTVYWFLKKNCPWNRDANDTISLYFSRQIWPKNPWRPPRPRHGHTPFTCKQYLSLQHYSQL